MHPLLEKYFQIIHSFIPNKKEESSIGLDIGSGECKLVELIRRSESYELLSWAIEPIINGNVSGAVQKILSKLHNPTKNVYTSVFGKGTLIRHIEMPRMSLEELKGSFDIEADKYFPFAQDQIYTDCYILDPQGKSKQMPILVAAAKRELIDQRIKLLTELGLQIEFIGINPIAVANALNVLDYKSEIPEKPAEGGKKTAIAIFDMGESVSNLTLMVNRLPVFTRDIFLGGREFTKRISNALGVTIEEAEKVKHQPGDKLPQVLNVCEPALMNMVQELRLSFDYFSTEKNCEITALLLTGGGSMLQGIEDLFEKNLDIKAKLWNLTAPLTISPKVSSPELNRNACKLGVALGLSLYHYA